MIARNHIVPRRLPAAQRRSRLLLLALVSTFSACADVSAPNDTGSRIVMDVRGLTGALAALGDGASIVQDVQLFVLLNRDSVVLHLTETLAPTDSIAEFDVALDPGTYIFDVFVYSNTNVLVYSGSRTARVPEVFPLEIIPQARAPVMVVSPRASTSQQPFAVRNVGSEILLWRLECVRLSTGNCIAGGQFADPAGGEVPPGSSQSVAISLTTGAWALTFTSAQGNVTVTATR